MSKIEEIENLVNTRNPVHTQTALLEILKLLRSILERLDELEYDIDRLKKKVE